MKNFHFKLINILLILMTFNFIYAQNDCDNLNPPADRIIDGTMPGGVNLSTLLPFNWSSDIVIIKGQLNIDVEQEIGNAEVYCMPGAAIHVLPDLDFRIFGSHFQGCSKLWKGIIIENNGFLKIDGESIIEDAEYGIHFKGDCEFYCNHTTFTNNYVGIYAEPTSQQKLIYGAPLGNVTFTSTRNILPHWENNEIENEMPYAGIFIYDVVDFSVGIGFPVFEGYIKLKNNFNHLKNAIISVNSRINIQYAIVEYLGIDSKSFYHWSENDDPLILDAAAFYSKNGWISLQNSETEYCNGLISYNSYNIVKNNIFGTIYSCPPINPNGVFINDNYNYKISEIAENNTVGEVWIWKTTGTPFEFHNNPGIKGSAYFIDTKLLSIKDNDFNCNDVTISNSLNTNFISNKFFQTYHLKANIANENSEGSLFYKNKITNDYPNRDYDGIFNTLDNGTEIICNSFNGSNDGLLFWGYNDPANVEGNTFTNCIKSIRITYSEIGLQPYKGNIFIGDNGEANTGVIEGSDPVSIALKSMFTINPLDPPDEGELEPTSYDPSDIENIWFDKHYKKNNAFCNQSLIIDPPEKRKPWWTKLRCDSLKDYLDSVLTKTINTPFKAQFLWDKKRYFYKYLKQDTILRDSCSFIDSLLQDIKGDTLDKFVDAEILIYDATELSEVQIEEIRSFDSQVNEFSSQIRAIDSLFIIDSLNRDSYVLQKKNILLQLRDVLSEYRIFENELESQKINKLNEALVAVNELQASTIYEISQKRYWQLKLKAMISGLNSLSSFEWDDISGIANLCPIEAGDGVLGARLMYRYINDTLQYDDDELCGLYDKSKLILKNTNISTKSLVDIFPNPAKQEWNIKIENKDQNQIVVEVVDMQGRVLKRFNFGTKTNIMEKIQIPDMDTGILFAKIYMDDKLYSTKKLLKLK